MLKTKRKEKGQGCEKGRAAGLLRCCCGRSVTQFYTVVLLCKSCPADVKTFDVVCHTNTALKLNFCCRF